jgi:Ulp1 family protease
MSYLTFLLVYIQVINFYMKMLDERDRELCAKNSDRKRSYYSNSFFMSQGKKGYSNVQKWTKNKRETVVVDIFNLNKLFFPVNHHNTHWSLLVVFMRAKEIHHYDSLNGQGTEFSRQVINWLGKEMMDKKGLKFDESAWKTYQREPHVPQQTNTVSF